MLRVTERDGVGRSGEMYFSLIATGGELTLPSGSIAPWDAKGMFYCNDAIIEHILEPALGDRKVTTPEELHWVLELSEQSSAKIRVFVHEALEEIVKQLMD